MLCYNFIGIIVHAEPLKCPRVLLVFGKAVEILQKKYVKFLPQCVIIVAEWEKKIIKKFLTLAGVFLAVSKTQCSKVWSLCENKDKFFLYTVERSSHRRNIANLYKKCPAETIQKS